MKITTNFTRPASRLVPYLGVGLWGAALLATVAAVTFAYAGYRVQQDAGSLQSQLQDLRARQAALHEVAPPPSTQLAALKAKVALINTLPERGAEGLLAALLRLETLLPPQASIVEIRYQRQDNGLTLRVEAPQASDLVEFLHRVQNDATFTHVLLTKHGERALEDGPRIQFEIRMVSRAT